MALMLLCLFIICFDICQMSTITRGNGQGGESYNNRRWIYCDVYTSGDCYVDCEYGGCKYTDIRCNDNHGCYIKCAHGNACNYATISGNNITHLQLDCNALAWYQTQSSCDNIVVKVTGSTIPSSTANVACYSQDSSNSMCYAAEFDLNGFNSVAFNWSSQTECFNLQLDNCKNGISWNCHHAVSDHDNGCYITPEQIESRSTCDYQIDACYPNITYTASPTYSPIYSPTYSPTQLHTDEQKPTKRPTYGYIDVTVADSEKSDASGGGLGNVGIICLIIGIIVFFVVIGMVWYKGLLSCKKKLSDIDSTEFAAIMFDDKQEIVASAGIVMDLKENKVENDIESTKDGNFEYKPVAPSIHAQEEAGKGKGAGNGDMNDYTNMNNNGENEGLNGMEEERARIREWFDEEVGIYEENDRYYKLFVHHGFDSIKQIKQMEMSDLEVIGVDKFGHRKAIIYAIDKL